MFIINSFWYLVVMAWCKLMKTGQTTSYRTGDDGDLEVGRDVDFSTLDANNPFGNTNRFTDELGGQTYTNDIVIDWSTFDGSTVLGIYKVSTLASTNGWNEAIDDSLTFSIGSFTTGWRLPNAVELANFMNYEPNRFLNYAPFNDTSNRQYWTSTTSGFTSASAINLGNQQSVGLKANAKTSLGLYYMPVRTFTVTGTTLS